MIAAVGAVNQTLRIGQLAKATGFNSRTLRYYEAIGLLRPATRAASGYRLYEPQAVERLKLVRRARELGLPLADVREILHASDAGLIPCGHVMAAVDKQLANIAVQIRRLRSLRSELSGLNSKLTEAMESQTADRGRPCPCMFEEGTVSIGIPTPPVPRRP